MTNPASTLTARPLRRDAVQNRKRLLAAAVVVFAEHGLDAGVEEVARAAGVGVGTLYRRFPSKQALIDELIADMRQQLLDAAHTATQCTDGTGLESLLFATGALQSAHLGCLTRLWKQSAAGVEAIEQFRAIIVTSLIEAQRCGRIRPEVTPGDISMILWSVSNTVEVTAGYAPHAWRRHLELMLAGLRPDGERTVLREAPLTLTPYVATQPAQPRQ